MNVSINGRGKDHVADNVVDNAGYMEREAQHHKSKTAYLPDIDEAVSPRRNRQHRGFPHPYVEGQPQDTSPTPSMSGSGYDSLECGSFFERAPSGPHCKPHNMAKAFVWELFDVQSGNARKVNSRYYDEPEYPRYFGLRTQSISPRTALTTLTPSFFYDAKVVEDVRDSEALFAALQTYKILGERGAVYQFVNASRLGGLLEGHALSLVQLKKIEWTLKLIMEFRDFKKRRQFEAVHYNNLLMELKWVGVPDDEPSIGSSIFRSLRTLMPLGSDTGMSAKVTHSQNYWEVEEAWADSLLEPAELRRLNQQSVENLRRRRRKDDAMRAEFDRCGNLDRLDLSASDLGIGIR